MQPTFVGLFLNGGIDLQTLFQPAPCIFKEQNLMKKGPGPGNLPKWVVILSWNKNENISVIPLAFKMSVDDFLQAIFSLVIS